MQVRTLKLPISELISDILALILLVIVDEGSAVVPPWCRSFGPWPESPDGESQQDQLLAGCKFQVVSIRVITADFEWAQGAVRLCEPFLTRFHVRLSLFYFPKT